MTAHTPTAGEWHAALHPDIIALERLEAIPAPMWRAHRRVEWRHFRALLDRGVPAKDLARGGMFTFGIVTIQGREMIVTDDARLRGYIDGPVMAVMPGANNEG